MDPNVAVYLLLAYFVLLFLISLITGKNSDGQTFFTANRNSPWYVVAFGMIGASLSGVTFISIPGTVAQDHWGYMQMVFGYLLGYAIIALVLMPMYYRLNLTSIYEYLKERYGIAAYKTGSLFFQLSRIIGASLRLYLVALVLQIAICDPLGIPFWITVAISIGLIFVYTFRGGIKTVVWTDTLQTAFMLVSAGVTVWLIGDALEWTLGDMASKIWNSDYSQILYTDPSQSTFFGWKFLSGAAIAVVMTGLDQDMMQKNLTCRNLEEAQKNIFSFSIVLVIANFLFLSLGALLFLYGEEMGVVQTVFEEGCKLNILNPDTGTFDTCVETDRLFPRLALDFLGPVAGGLFLLGVVAAAYSSADSALTALTTAFCVDILNFSERTDEAEKQQIRYKVHIGYALVLFAVVLIFNAAKNEAVIWELFKAAGYTYGPLLGLYAYGMFTKFKVRDNAIPWVCVLAPILSYGIAHFSPIVIGYTFGFEILLVNALLTVAGLVLATDWDARKD
ncbi:sodium:solute symporter [Pontibacter sp. G13]|uniref:sodium:solute symporter n=1 Tax=Pontibacter sp. G13 TaxID=3074898 RepID=UPI00288A4E02|nr:sodium:solute symporter [Pontibacter sp. G13]WNJ16083.1 sodium:solute symporter [Pontibacter sp. G13]